MDAGENKHQPGNVFIHKLHCLLIGIDNYPKLNFLRGAVADANAMEKFLTFDLSIPSEHIIILRNEEVTRLRILQEFQALWQNKDIHHGDPILIYYAGHGGLRDANNEWKARYGSQQIQVIFPFDYLQEDLSPQNPESPLVNSIPDRIVATLLNELAAKKGNNVTVIFDSCHSASGTREVDDESSQDATEQDQRYRSAEATLDIPCNIDDDLFAFYGIDPSLRVKQPRDAQLLLYTDQASHVHLAACGIDEKALEQDGGGIFTTELLKKIRTTQHPPYNGQSPQCYGAHKNRILFDSRISSVTFTPVIFEDSTWVLKAGVASGITDGSTWERHKDPIENSKSIGLFKVTHLYTSNAVLEPQSPTNNKDRLLYARFVHAGEGNELALKVWMSPKDSKLLFGNPEPNGKRKRMG
ncbi:hypothetical protein OPQ81_003631 [Rhizoctonia solani]|nr:hypothetical protein OPQ81_003631 [Rhizoctonia solani]